MTTQVAHRGQTIVAPDKDITRTSVDFTDGVVCGYLMYFDDYAGTGLTDVDIYPLLGTVLNDTRYSDMWLAGYVVSVCEALLLDRDVFGVVSSSN